MKSAWKSQLPPFRRHKQKVYSQIISTGKFIYQIGESGLLRKPSKELIFESDPKFSKRAKFEEV